MGTRSLVALACLIAPFASTVAVAQQRFSIEDRPEWSSGKYTQQLAIEVGDVPEHKVRTYELHYVFNDQSQLAISGLKVKEGWSRGYSDYVGGRGKAWGYTVWELEGGSKVFMEFSGTTIANSTSTGSIKGSYHGISRFTGGTGKLSGIQGWMADTNEFDNDSRSGYNKSESKGEYWFQE